MVKGDGYLGDFNPSDPITIFFNTYRYDTGAPITLAGGPAVKVYKDGDATSEVTTGLTLSVDFDSVTGLHSVAVVTTNAFYAANSRYTVFVSAGTVNGVSVVGMVVGSFTLQKQALTYFATNRPTMALKQLSITPAVNTDGVTITPSGTGKAINALGPVLIASSVSGQEGLRITSVDSGAVYLGNNGHSPTLFIENLDTLDHTGAVAFLTHNLGSSLYIGSGGPDATIQIEQFGAGDGNAIDVFVDGGGNGSALSLIPGTGKAINALGQIHVAPTSGDDDALILRGIGAGNGLSSIGGLSGGFGGFLSGNGPGGIGLEIDGDTDTDALRLVPLGTGKAINALGQVAITTTGSANAIDIAADTGIAINVVANGDNPVVSIDATKAMPGVSNAIYLHTNGRGDLISIVADAVGSDAFGIGIYTQSTGLFINTQGNNTDPVVEFLHDLSNGDALLLAPSGTGKSINAAVETGADIIGSLRLANAANGGKTNGLDTTTVHVRDVNDTKNRVTATVDSSGNRTATTLDLT